VETILVVGQIAVDGRLLERDKPVDILQVGALAVVILAHLADLREGRLEREATLDIHGRLGLVEEEEDLVVVRERGPEARVLQRSLGRPHQRAEVQRWVIE